MDRHSLTAPAVASAALLAPLAVLDRRMQATGGPGIIPFELAGPDRSETIMHIWGAEGQRAAQMSLLLDFPFLLAYTMLNIRLTERAGEHASGAGNSGLGSLRRLVSAVQVAAGACDAIENTALLGVLARGGHARLASIAQHAARVKFAGLITGWLYGTAAISERRFN